MIFKHRKKKENFTRERKLPLDVVVGLVLQKSVKSVQVRLNEFFDYVQERTVSASAYSQARAKFSHELFIELNQSCFVSTYYEDSKYKKFKGHRLLAVDGSKIRLPDTAEMQEEFGSIKIKNQHIEAKYTGGLCSAFYDVLNENVVDSILAQGSASERKLAQEHLELSMSGDLIVYDRGYSSYVLFAKVLENEADFICRCSSNAFGVVEEFIESKQVDQVVTLVPCKDIDLDGLPKSLKIRLVKIELNTGEIEILATSLLNKKTYTRRNLKKLYGLRWGVETYFDRLKNRLSLENFTGKTVESVKQDFYATILISNVESELTQDAQEILNLKNDNKHQQKVNKAVSFNAIKQKAYDLFFATDDIEYDDLIAQLQNIFLMNPVPIRPNRKPHRQKHSPRRSLRFHKYHKKHAF